MLNQSSSIYIVMGILNPAIFYWEFKNSEHNFCAPSF